jgi:hypothetical protein
MRWTDRPPIQLHPADYAELVEARGEDNEQIFAASPDGVPRTHDGVPVLVDLRVPRLTKKRLAGLYDEARDGD